MLKITELLMKLGLNDKEIKVFLSLAKLGPSGVSKIALDSGVTRTHVYDVAEGLKQKGLLTEIEEKGLRKYEVLDHAGLMAFISRKQKEFLTLEKKLVELATEFETLRVGERHKTKVRFFEGPEGIRTIYAEIRSDLQKKKEASELLTIFSPAQVERALPGWFEAEEYIEVPAHMNKRGILYASDITRRYLEKIKASTGAHQYKLWPPEQGEFPVDTLSWGNKITYIDLVGYPSGIVIENEAIVRTFRMWFEKMWENL